MGARVSVAAHRGHPDQEVRGLGTDPAASWGLKLSTADQSIGHRGRAGVIADDIITDLDGQPVQGPTLDQGVEMMGDSASAKNFVPNQPFPVHMLGCRTTLRGDMPESPRLSCNFNFLTYGMTHRWRYAAINGNREGMTPSQGPSDR